MRLVYWSMNCFLLFFYNFDFLLLFLVFDFLFLWFLMLNIFCDNFSLVNFLSNFNNWLLFFNWTCLSWATCIWLLSFFNFWLVDNTTRFFFFTWFTFFLLAWFLIRWSRLLSLYGFCCLSNRFLYNFYWLFYNLRNNSSNNNCICNFLYCLCF